MQRDIITQNINEVLIGISHKMWDVSRVAIAVNMPSDKVDFRNDYSTYYNPGAVLDIAYNFSRRVVWRNDMLPFQPALIIYKDELFQPETSVYNASKEEFDEFVRRKRCLQNG